MKKLIALTLTLAVVLTLGLVPAVPAAAADPDPVLVARWSLDGDGMDTSDNDNDGTVVSNEANPFVDGLYGQALSLDGDDYFHAPRVGMDKTQGTFELWVKPLDLTVLPEAFMVIGVNVAAPNNYQIQYWTDGKLYFRVNKAGQEVSVKASTVGFTEDAWHHLAMTWDSLGVKAYVDHVLVGSYTGAMTFPYDLVGEVYIGAWYTGGRQAIALVDEARIWSTALTQSQLDDMTPPTITITGLEDGDIFRVGAPAPDIAYDAEDGVGTGLASIEGGLFDTTAAGIYYYTVTAEDYAKNVATEEVMYVVYDPSAGFVTGGGWIMSPEDAYSDNPELTGKANFGFVSKYKKGANTPDGQTEFQFKAGDLNFHSTSYDWLVVTGSNFAKFKGTGTINGEGEYTFQIWAGDGDSDTFRIKIWEENGGEVVIYDNGMNQPIGGGSIVVHTK